MRLYILFIVVTYLVIVAETAYASYTTLPSQLITALIVVESNGDDHALGDRHMKKKAYGCLQIRQPCVDDVNRRYGTKFKAEDMLGNRQLSIWVCAKYLEMYGTSKRLGREPRLEDLARIWNGGPDGWRGDATLHYWVKVKKNLR